MKRALAFAVMLLVCAGPAWSADFSSVATLAKPQALGKPWKASELARAQARIGSLLETPPLRGAHIGVLVQDLTTKTIVFSRLPDDDFIPASNLKLLTGSTFLNVYGPAYRFHTALESSASVQDGVLGGDLILSLIHI